MATSGFCPHCGAPHAADDAFCGSCGRRLTEAEPEAASGPAAPAFTAEPAPPPPMAPTPAEAVTSVMPPVQSAPPPQPPAAPPQYPQYQQPQPTYPQAPQPLYQPPPSTTRAVGGVKLRPVPLIGAAAVVIGAALPWFSAPGGPSATSFKVPFGFLIDPQKTTDPKIGVILLIVGLAGAALTFVPVSGVVRRLLGVAAILIGGVFIGEVARALNDVGSTASVTKVVGVGAYVTIAGGLLLAAGR